jgi:hypothetical protein
MPGQAVLGKVVKRVLSHASHRIVESVHARGVGRRPWAAAIALTISIGSAYRLPFDQLQAEQIELFREAWSRASHAREPRVSVSRGVIPITSDLDRRLFGADANEDQVGWVIAPLSPQHLSHSAAAICVRSAP